MLVLKGTSQLADFPERTSLSEADVCLAVKEIKY
jgi:hypothetical protein